MRNLISLVIIGFIISLGYFSMSVAHSPKEYPTSTIEAEACQAKCTAFWLRQNEIDQERYYRDHNAQ